MGFLTKTRQETGAGAPPRGGNGRYLSNDLISSREVVFGIVGVDYDGENSYQGTPRPRWLISIVPWYDGEELPIEDPDTGRITTIEGGLIYVSSRQGIDQMMEALQDQLDSMPEGERIIDEPAVLIKRKMPGRGNKYYDLVAWDEESEQPVLDEGDEYVPPEADEPAPPVRPSSRPAAQRPGASRRRPAEAGQEPDGQGEAPTASPPARSGGRSRPGATRNAPAGAAATQPSSGFGVADGAESGDGSPAPAAPASASYDLVNKVLGGDPGNPYQPGELGGEYELTLAAFPPIKQWCLDHSLPVPAGRGRITPAFYQVHAIALEEWTHQKWELERQQSIEQSNAVRTSPNPAVRSGAVVPTGAAPAPQAPAAAPEAGPAAADPARTTPPRRGGLRRSAEVPANALHQNEAQRPADAPVRPADKAAWMPPDQRDRLAAGGPTAAQEYSYSPGAEGRSIDPCPGGCGANGTNDHVLGRAYPSGAGGYSIVHQCPGDHTTRPLQVQLTGRMV